MTLYGPVIDEGFCLRDENLQADRLNWCDFGAPLTSGGIVMVFLRKRTGVEIALKRLEYTRNGQWWLVAYDTRDEDSLIAWPIWNHAADRPTLPLLALAPVVKRREIPRRIPREPYVAKRSEDFARYLRELGADAVNEWRTQGFPPPACFAWTNKPEDIEAIHAGRSSRPQFC